MPSAGAAFRGRESIFCWQNSCRRGKFACPTLNLKTGYSPASHETLKSRGQHRCWWKTISPSSGQSGSDCRRRSHAGWVPQSPAFAAIVSGPLEDRSKDGEALLRHSEVKMTLQLCAHSVSANRMTAQGEVLQAILASMPAENGRKRFCRFGGLMRCRFSAISTTELSISRAGYSRNGSV
jgi:hypothetical protein